jgi:DNA-binding NtrC family response regulator
MEQNKKNILVIDDEEVILELFQELLSKDGYVVKVTRTGEEGLAAMGKEFFNLAIVDKNLPGISGLEVIKRAKKLNPDTEMIIITAYGSVESVMEAIKLGVLNYLTKPFEDLKNVREIIRKALRRQDDRFALRKLMEEMAEGSKR